MNDKSLNKIFTGCLMLTALIGGINLPAQAAGKDVAPEIVSSVWEESNKLHAAISINGREIISFISGAAATEAADQAEDLSLKLEELINDKKFDANQLLPAREGTSAAIKHNGATVVTFNPELVNASADTNNACLESSLKLVNGLRTAFGVPTLPGIFDMNDKAAMSSTDSKNQHFSGRASWYGERFHGRKTSDGHRFDMDKLTAAHRSLPFGTKLLVMNRKTGNSCVVEVNDRGPFIDGRIIDVSKGAAQKLNMVGSGVALVDCLVLGQD